MRPLVPVLLLAALAACETPQQRCEVQATRDLRIVNELIAESQATLQRGYALEEVEIPRVGANVCLGGYNDVGYGFCWGNSAYTTLEPVAVNLAEERATLQSLLQKRDELEVQARAQLAACERLPPG